MFVCLCSGVTEQDIQNELEQGAGSVKELSQRLGVGAQCGRCVGYAKQLIQQHKRAAQFDFELAYSAA